MSKISVMISYRIPKELADKLEIGKWLLKRSKTQIVVEALEEYFHKHGIHREENKEGENEHEHSCSRI